MARTKSEFLKAFGKSFEIFKLIVDVVLDLGGDDEDLLRLLKDKERVKRIGEIIVEHPKTEEQPEYVTPILDADVPERHKATLAKYRKLATDHGVPATTAVCYRVKAGFTLKSHAPKAGPCYEQYAYLQGWNLPDEATSDCIVFWVPRIIMNSTSKTKQQQIELLSNLRTQLELPTHHMSGFGKVGLLAGLLLAHYKATGERIPLNQYWVRTDTCGADGRRLDLGNFDDTGLNCNNWNFDDNANDNLGVFALMMEKVTKKKTSRMIGMFSCDKLVSETILNTL